MTAPTVPYTTIPAGDYDPDSAITVDLMTAMINNTDHVRQWLGGGYTAAIAHMHDGVDSALLPGNVAGALYLFYRYT